ncbi:MAG: alpha/beta fold hydrolase, partial [Aquabacterium sp.]
LVGLDIGDAGSRAHVAGLDWRAKLGIAMYQLALVAAYRLGGRLGDGLARRTARMVRAPADPATVHAGMGWPYDATWLGSNGGMPKAPPLQPPCPMLFLYGTRKPVMFHSAEWAKAIAARPGCTVQGLRTGHWLMLNDPQAFHQAVLGWLEPAALPAAA